MAEDRLLLTVAEMAEQLAIGRTRAYELVASGQIPSVRVGKNSIRIAVAALQQWVDERGAANATGAGHAA